MPIDVSEALTAGPRTEAIDWDGKDVILYHLGIGAGVPATDPDELRYTLETRLQVLPGFVTVAGGTGTLGGALSAPGVDVRLADVLHAGQSIELHRAVPVAGSAVRTSRIVAVHDKGEHALLVQRDTAADADGPLWTSDSQIFVRGEGGFGGDRGTRSRVGLPAREPDVTVDRRVREDQALLYRLCGDFNPLHADPEFAELAGFDRPILHGLCSYGIVLKAVVDTLLGGEAARVRAYTTRFAGVCYPGETLRVRMWRGEHRVHVVATAVERDDAPVLGDTLIAHS